MQDIFRSQFRLPHELADKLREASEASGRSMNAEVVSRLESSFAMAKTQEPGFVQLVNRLLEATGQEVVEDGLTLKLSIQVSKDGETEASSTPKAKQPKK